MPGLATFSTVEFTCKGFPGPGVTLPMARNPMFEFVGAHGYKEEHRSHKVDSDFEEFKGQHGREYDNEKEEGKRKTHFKHNHRWADSHTLTPSHHSVLHHPLLTPPLFTHLTPSHTQTSTMSSQYTHSSPLHFLQPHTTHYAPPTFISSHYHTPTSSHYPLLHTLTHSHPHTTHYFTPSHTHILTLPTTLHPHTLTSSHYPLLHTLT